MTKFILLPNLPAYMDYINTILVDSVLTDTTPTSTVEPTTKIAKMMVNEDMYLIIDQEAQ